MLRFGSVAGRGLRTQSTNILIGSTSRGSQNYVQFPCNYNSTVATNSAPSYEWVSSGNSEFKFNKDKSEQEFQEVLVEIKQRLRRVQVPHSARPFVFRPKNAQLLRSLHLTDKDGNAYQSEVWKGPPNSKQLMKLIRRVTNAETAGITQEILGSYIKHYPKEVQSIHIATFLRTAARAGYFYKVLDLVQSPIFKGLINSDVAKEVVRLYSIRAATLNKESAYKDLSKLFSKMSKYTEGSIDKQLDTHLLMVYGLAPYCSEAVANDQSRGLINYHLSVIKQLLSSEVVIPTDAKVAKYHGLNYYYMNLVLGRLGLNTLSPELRSGVDMAKLDELISSIDTVFAANKTSSPLERYVKHASQGIQAETEKARESLSEEEVKEGAEEE